MWWNPQQILGYARQGGFDAQRAKTAAAVSLVATQGADHYRWSDPTTPGVDQRGLWALTPDQGAAQGVDDLMVPTDSARALYGLWADAGGSFDWHPVVAADNGRMVACTLDALEHDGLWLAKAGHMFGVIGDIRRFQYSGRYGQQVAARFGIN